MVDKMVEKLKKRVVRSFMDILVLTEINNNPMSGYDAISFIHKKYDILLSAGTVYSMLYSLEREGLLIGTSDNQKRVYTLTEKGEQKMQTITKASNEIQNVIQNFSSISG